MKEAKIIEEGMRASNIHLIEGPEGKGDHETRSPL